MSEDLFDDIGFDPDDLEEYTRDEFREEVYDRLDTRYPEIIIKRVVEDVERSNDQLDETHVNWCRLLAGILEAICFSDLFVDQEHRYLWTTDRISLVPPDSLSDDTLLHSNQVLDQIEPATRETRAMIFGDSDAPFDDYARMCRWIRSCIDEHREEVDDEAFQDGRRDMRERIMSLISEYRNRYGEVSCSFRTHRLRYYDIPEWEVTTMSDIPPGSRLDPLFSYLREYTARTGFTEPALVLFVMTGVRPILPRWKLEKRERENPDLPDTFSLDLFAGNITERDFQRIHRKIKELKNVSDMRPLDEKDRVLIEVVDTLGGVPDEGVEAFWRDVLDRCQQRGIESWSTSNSAKMRWRRLQEDL